MATIILRGPFRLIAADGRDLTPESPLRQAILAVLATAPRQIRARTALQALFWTEIDAARASASLRTALYLLRRDLAPLGPDVLRADRLAVSLAPGAIRLAPGTAAEGELLDGLDLGMASCEAFEDWLRDLRQRDLPGLAEPPGTAPLAPPVAPPQAPASARESAAGPATPALAQPSRRVALGLLPAVQDRLSRADTLRVVGFVDAVAAAVRLTTQLDIHDLRGLEGQVAPLPLDTGLGATHWLQPVAERRGRRLILRLRLLDGPSRRLVWLSDAVTGPDLDDPDTPAGWAERILHRLHRDLGDPWQPNLFPLTAISALFSLDGALVADTDAQLARLHDRDGAAHLACLRLFAQVFRVNEVLGPGAPVDPDATLRALAGMDATDPMLPLCQSIVGYALHMLHARNDLALHLMECAQGQAPRLALNLDHLAVIRLAQGDLGGAETSFLACQRAGAHSPWRYTYDVTGAMVSLAQGDYRQAQFFANQALFRQPRYLAALRYSMAALALAGRHDDARRMQARIRQLRPGLDLGPWAEAMLRRTRADLGAAIIGGLRAAAIL